MKFLIYMRGQCLVASTTVLCKQASNKPDNEVFIGSCTGYPGTWVIEWWHYASLFGIPFGAKMKCPNLVCNVIGWPKYCTQLILKPAAVQRKYLLQQRKYFRSQIVINERILTQFFPRVCSFLCRICVSCLYFPNLCGFCWNKRKQPARGRVRRAHFALRYKKI